MPADRSDKESYIEGILYSKQRDGQKMRWDRDRGGSGGEREGEWYITRERELCRNLILLSGWRVEKLSSLLPLPLSARAAHPHPATTSPHQAALGHPPTTTTLDRANAHESERRVCLNEWTKVVGISARTRACASTRSTSIPRMAARVLLCT